MTAEQHELDEIEVAGNKFFINRTGDTVVLQAVNDERPLVRMTFGLGLDDAADLAFILREAIGGESSEHVTGRPAIYDEVRTERESAHAKHGDTSMESYPVDDLNRLAILTEELGEVAEEFNEARHRCGPVDLPALRKELIQTAAMAAAWAEAITQGH